MAKPLKITLIVLGAVLALLLGLAIALPLLIDPNDYREKIQASVKDSTGRDFSFGKIDLKVFPWIALRISDASLGNAAGFGAEPFAQIAQADAGVRLLPLLLDRRVEASTVTLKGLVLNLAKDKDGKNNWSDLAKPDDQEPEKPDQPGEFKLENLNIGGIEIDDASLRYSDAQTGKNYQVEKLNLDTGSITPGEPFDLKLALKLLSAAPALNADIELQSTLDANLDTKAYMLKDLKLGVKNSGKDQTTKIDMQGDGMLDLAAQKLALDGLKLKFDSAKPEMKILGTLTGGLRGDLAAQVFDLSGVKLDGKARGKAVPGGEQDFALTGALRYDAKQGAVKFTDAVLQAVGLTINTSVTGENLLGDAPKFTGPIKLQPFNPRELMAKLGKQAPQTTDPEVLKQMSFSANFSGGANSAVLSDVKLKLDQTSGSGRVNITSVKTQAIEFALKLDQLDADRYLPPRQEPGAGAAQKENKKELSDTPLPNDALNNLNAQGTLDVGLFKLRGIKMSNAQVKLAGGKGEVKTQNIAAKLYGGSVAFNNRFTPGPKPQYATSAKLNTLDATPFLRDFLDKDFVSGLATVNFDLSGAGLKAGDLLRTLNGEAGFKLENGAVKGFNLGSILRKGKAALAGNFNYTETEAKKTDFAAMTASARIVNGILKSDSLSAASPLFRLTGAGEIDLFNQTINYLAKPTIVETSSGEGGKALADLRGITIPIKLTGNLFDPKYKLDLEDALKQKALGKINQKLEENKGELKQKLDDEINRGLNRLFKQKPPPPTPAPAPAELPTP